MKCHRQICDRGIFRFTRSVRHNRPISCLMRQFHRSCRLCQCPDLIHLDEHRIGCFSCNPQCDSLRIGHKQIVSHKLYLLSNFCCQSAPAIPILLIQRILNGIDWIIQNQSFIVFHHLIRCSRDLFPALFAFPHKIIPLFFCPVNF